MRILRVIATMDPQSGGPCQGIRNSIPAMLDVGVENEVLSFDAPDAAFLHKDAFPIHAIGPAKTPYAYCKLLPAWLEQNFYRFDAVIIHGLWLYNSYGTYKAWEKYKATHVSFPKLFVMPHGMLDPYFQEAKGRRLKAIRNYFFWKLIESRVVNGADGVLFTCAQELLLARQAFKPYHPAKELNVGYGIQQPPVFTAEMKRAFEKFCPGVKNKPYLLFLSRIHPKKGVDILVNAYLALKKVKNNLPALVIAGPGLETDFGKKIQAMAAADGEIYFPGMLQDQAKWGAYYGCEAFVLPSHQENFGIAVVEALACGKPVLITDKVNIWREIIGAKAGLSAADTAEGTLQLLGQWTEMGGKEKSLMRGNASSLFQTHFSSEQSAQVLIQTISALL